MIEVVRSWLPTWSVSAALRAVRAALVVPGLFAITFEVIGDLQMATFAAFGGFATLVLAGFGGRRRDRALAHLGLAVAGSVLLVIGTAVNSSVVLAAVVTLVVAFLVLFAGVAGPNATAGGLAAMLAYVLPAASPGTLDMVPSRLAGWWMASAAGTLAVLLITERPAADRLRVAVATSAQALSDLLAAGLRGEADDARRHASREAKNDLLEVFVAAPVRPTGLTASEQALDSLIGLLEWGTTVVCESLSEYDDLRACHPVEQRLLAATADVLAGIAATLRGAAERPDVAELEAALAASVDRVNHLASDDPGYGEAVHVSFHARTVALTARNAAADALTAVGAGGRTPAGLAGAATVAVGHASLRSVRFVNSARGATAIAAAVAVADLSSVQRGFWVVLATLSVLRTNAAATGSTVLRALLGTVAGFAVGAALLLVIGTSTTALWITLPIAVLAAAYAQGTAPFAVGQAAFTIVISVLFNLLVPTGWKIGVLRVEDVAIGCAVSLAVGLLFWPRGAGAVVADDLADAFRAGAAYLRGAVGWALGLRHDAPPARPALTAGVRLDDAMRGFLTEQGTKHVPKQDLWRLAAGTARLRITADSLAGLPNPSADPDSTRRELGDRGEQLAGWFDGLAERLGPPGRTGAPTPLDPPVLAPLDLSTGPGSCTLWINEHLNHIAPHLAELVGPAQAVAAQRRAPWWR